MRSFVFPGQGAQHKGMGAELFAKHPELTAQADEILGYSIEELCVDDPHERLMETQFTQPALFVVSALSLAERAMEPPPEFLVGHSLGEFGALHAAGVMDFGTGLRLVKRRGELMTEAQGGGMAAVVGLDEAQVREVLRTNRLESLDVANLNAMRQIVLAGPRDDIAAAKSVFQESGCRAYIILKVSGAFHSRYMAAARDELRRYLQEFDFAPPKIPVISNVTARPYTGISQIRELVGMQMDHPVRWMESICYLMGRGCTEFIEVGPGIVLTKLIKTIQKECPQPVVEVSEGGAQVAASTGE